MMKDREEVTGIQDEDLSAYINVDFYWHPRQTEHLLPQQAKSSYKTYYVPLPSSTKVSPKFYVLISFSQIISPDSL